MNLTSKADCDVIKIVMHTIPSFQVKVGRTKFIFLFLWLEFKNVNGYTQEGKQKFVEGGGKVTFCKLYETVEVKHFFKVQYSQGYIK